MASADGLVGRARHALASGQINRDVVVAAIVLVFCAVAYGVTLTFDQAPSALAQNVQPARFPQLVLAVMAVFAVIILVNGLTADEAPLKPVKPMVFASAVIMVGFVIAIHALGFFEAASLLCLALPILWGERRWHLVVPFAVLLPIALWVLFVQLFEVYFEPGVVRQLLG